MNKSRYTNVAFIFCRREDEEWTKRLQNKLKHYKQLTEITKENLNLECEDNPVICFGIRRPQWMRIGEELFAYPDEYGKHYTC